MKPAAALLTPELGEESLFVKKSCTFDRPALTAPAMKRTTNITTFDAARVTFKALPVLAEK
jgi:hypothetical protein